ncbi:quercetin dioxygenase-like cupin family protein [Elusimicrobium simillimum]|uniref:cupin domain-containing protein n=1 Tax=Elusimicrobium simillimum TaxID=3143438 RepID=UPI003C701666
MPSDKFLLEKQLNWEPAGDKVRRQIMGYNNDLMLVKVEFETAAVGAEHSHPHTQSTYVAKGKFKVNISGDEKILETGDGFLVEPNALHWCVCLEEGILIDSFSPCRQDFLK